MNLTKLLAITCTLFVSTTSFAEANPVIEDTKLTNSEFSQKIYEALQKNSPPKPAEKLAGSQMDIISIDGGFTCTKHVSLGAKGHNVSYSCYLMADQGWNTLGMSSFGSGDNQELSEAIYKALDVQVERDGPISSKTIELNVPDNDGGTERNRLSCILPTKKVTKEFGIVSTCQVINAL